MRPAAPSCCSVADVHASVLIEEGRGRQMLMMQLRAIACLPIWVAGCLISGVAALSELPVRWLVPCELRATHTTVAASMFNVVGTTNALLLVVATMPGYLGFSRTHTRHRAGSCDLTSRWRELEVL